MPKPCRRSPVHLRLAGKRKGGEAEKALAEAQALKLQARLEDLNVWEMKKVKQSRKAARRAMCTWEAAGRWMARRPGGRPGRGRRRGSMRIELTRGKHAIVDVNDADLVRSRNRPVQSPLKGIA
jgi:hypothetical protein